MVDILFWEQRQAVSPDTIRLLPVRSTNSEPTLPAQIAPQMTIGDVQFQSIREGSITTDDSVSNPGN